MEEAERANICITSAATPARTYLTGRMDVAGLSSYTLFGGGHTNVPDGGSTIILLDLAFAAVAMLARRQWAMKKA